MATNTPPTNLPSAFPWLTCSDSRAAARASSSLPEKLSLEISREVSSARGVVRSSGERPASGRSNPGSHCHDRNDPQPRLRPPDQHLDVISGARPAARCGGSASPPASSHPAATAAFAALVDAAGVSLAVGGEAIPLVGFAQLTFVAAIIGTVLAVVLHRRADRPRHTFVVTTIALTALSFVPDVLADAPTRPRGSRSRMSHVVAAAIVIPALASRLTD